MRTSLAVLALVALLDCTGCTGTADRRLMVIHESKLVLRHSTTEPAWLDRRAKCEAELQTEDPDATPAGAPTTTTTGGK